MIDLDGQCARLIGGLNYAGHDAIERTRIDKAAGIRQRYTMTDPPTDPAVPSPEDARSQLRIPVAIEGGVANSTIGRRSAMLVDISSQGCRVDWPFGAAVGMVVVLSIPGLAPIGARIRWKNTEHIGLSFNAPLHPSVLDRIVSLSGA